VAQAREAAEHGVDVVIAQGAEAGGQGMAPGVNAHDEWKRRIVEIESEETVRFETWSAIVPAGGGYEVVPRVIRTDFVTRWERQADEARQQAEQLRAQVMATIQEQRPHE
jgi:enoyl-[acyl-carrier protein] reductase II